MPIKILNFATNFELSTLGATGIVRILIDIGLKTDCRKAASYADVNSKVPNLGFFGLPVLEKLSENRRIFIRLVLEARLSLNLGSGKLILLIRASCLN